MNPNGRGDGRPAGRGLRTDGGSPMPGVPEEEEEPDPEPAPSSSSNPPAGSGSQMPGVPETKGPEPAVESGGGSCEAPEHEETEDAEAEPHELTTAFTLDALTRLENPASVVSEARAWSDWVGVVGDVDAPTLNTFLRRESVDIDFFNGVADPQERLARVAKEGSAFHSDRLVLVGAQGQADLAPADDWEFETIESTAEEAGWSLK
jgi:hypothetical protein